MGGTYDMPIPEPPATPEVGSALPDLTADFAGDPLCRMLDKLEMSIEQTVPPPDMYADPLCRTLDGLEASVERHGSIIEPLTEPLHETLSRLENEIERQTLAAPKPMEALPDDVGMSRQNAPYSALNKASQSINEVTQKTEGVHRMPSLKQHSEPSRRMTGHSTGIRNSGHELAWYCNIHRKWVSEDECESCPDFEDLELITEDEKGERCKHSFFNMNDDADDEDFVSRSEDDEDNL